MSDVTTPAAVPSGGSAGQMLRAARQARGLDLDALAQLLKVPVRKLEALEEDRVAELPGLAFARSLAQSYARQVGLDPKVVLAALPQAVTPPQQLEKVSRGLQTPYRESSGAHFGRAGGAGFELRPVHWIAAGLLLLALLLWFAPPLRTLLEAVGLSRDTDTAATEAEAPPVNASAPGLIAEPVMPVPAAPQAASAAGVAAPASAVLIPAASTPVAVETVHSAPTPEPSASPAAPAASGPVVLRTRSDSWVEVRDAANAVLLSRTVPAGETVGLDGKMPLRVRIGVASAVEVSLRGEPVDLKPFTRGTTATAILK
ncbi:helix-turn-helix domain-containing protein [Sphaerotilus uruguayifluvii]|uniref:Cytoskeleton protein RodZ n=1 Tax=Sphaerotilus uruguayifluvii TaxID=2735897 RepID=A0ABX2G483_9BURK|nr:helix-turn-helix domain-containing protein [Leptothrix sp. C29]NRT57135.1 cytoskeleton protein RodZ [Leptothrix sp. C29]